MKLERREHLKSDVYAYLKRIGYDGPLDGSAAVLADLQECHLHAVPYENFDILNRVSLSLDIPDLIDKMIIRRRGGYCFELNALFGWLLRELGYPVTDLMARFWRDEPNLPPKRRHQVLQVKAGSETYLCDVGVGGIRSGASMRRSPFLPSKRWLLSVLAKVEIRSPEMNSASSRPMASTPLSRRRRSNMMKH